MIFESIPPELLDKGLSAVFGLAGWFGKTIYDRIRRVEDNQISCREGLVNRFADKKETQEALQKHDERLDQQGERIIRVEGKVGL